MLMKKLVSFFCSSLKVCFLLMKKLASFFLFIVKSLFLAHEEVIIDLYVEKIVFTKKKVEKIVDKKKVEKVMGFGMIIFTETDQL